METNELISEIVKRVIQSLESEKKEALIVFTGGSLGFSQSIAEIKKMIDDNWEIKIGLSRSAEYIVTPELIKEHLGVEKVYLESENKGLEPLYENISVLIVPTLTSNTAAKLACGIADSMTLNLISHALMTDIPVIAAKDAFDLSHEERKILGMKEAPKGFQALFDKHLKTIESFGIEMIRSSDIYESVQKLSNKGCES